MGALAWQRVFAALPPTVTVLSFDVDAISPRSGAIALTTAIEGWRRPVAWIGAWLARAATVYASEAAIAASMLRRLDDIEGLR